MCFVPEYRINWKIKYEKIKQKIKMKQHTVFTFIHSTTQIYNMNWAHITSLIYVRVGGQFSDSVDVSRFSLFNVFFFFGSVFESLFISASAVRRLFVDRLHLSRINREKKSCFFFISLQKRIFPQALFHSLSYAVRFD